MHPRSFAPTALALAAVLLSTALPAAADAGRPDSWPQYRGAARDGRVADVDLPARPGLEVAWKRPLGSGFSGIVAVDGKVLTAFTAGDDDVLAAFAADDGRELWRYRIGEKFPAVGGSSEGPLSTPTVEGGTVYGFGPWGDLFAVRLADGEKLWARRLGEGQALQPRFGFTTAPVLAGGSLIVQTGGPDGHSITAFDPATGEPRWSRADDAVQYQSPLAATIGGRELVLAVDERLFLGLEPASGEVLWSLEHELGSGYALPIDLADDRILISGLRDTAAYRVNAGDSGGDGNGDGGGWTAEELWRAKKALVRSWALPVLHDGHLYGFTGQFLTCVDASTGEVVWKSRPPGGRGLILIDDQLAMVDSEGRLVLAAATPEGYRETARVTVLDGGTYTAPSFAGGRFYVRDLERLAAVRITDAPAPAPAETSVILGRLGERAARVAGVEGAAESLLADLEKGPLPLIEGDDLAHFVYLGEAEDVAVAGLGLAEEQRELALERVVDRDGTTLFWARSFHLDPAAHRRYRFVLDFGEKTVPDPKNPHRMVDGEEEFSELRMPRWKPPAHLEEPEGERGRLETVDVGGRSVQVYLPPGYGESEDAKYPLLVVNRGDAALGDGKIDRVLDNLIAAGRVAPAVAALVPEKERGELHDGVDGYLRFLGDELVPALESRFRLHADPRGRAVFGTRDGGYAALYAAFRDPSLFGAAASQSLAAHAERVQGLEALIAGAEHRPRAVYLEWSAHDRFVKDSESLAAKLEGIGYDVGGKEVDGTPEWFSMSERWDVVLGRLLPPTKN